MESNRLLDGRLKIRHLVMIVALAETGGVMRASERLHLSQPAVTRGLKEAEEVLGAAIFTRHARGIEITDEGRTFLHYARSIVGQLSQAAHHVDDIKAGDAGSAIIGTHLSGSDQLLPRAILRLKRESPNILIHIIEERPERLTEMLLSREVDLVVGRVHDSPVDGVKQTLIRNEPIELIVRTSHPAVQCNDQQLTLHDLHRYPWIIPTVETAAGREVQTVFSRAGLALPRDLTLCTSLSTPLTLILESDAIAVLPSHMGNKHGLVALQVPELSWRRQLGIMQVVDTPLRPVARRIAEFLMDVLNE